MLFMYIQQSEIRNGAQLLRDRKKGRVDLKHSYRAQESITVQLLEGPV